MSDHTATSEFPFKLPPFQHQLDCFRISKDREYYALFMDQGVGKSKVILDTAANLYLLKKINALVVVAPKGVVHAWQDEQVPTHMSDAVPYRSAILSASLNREGKRLLARAEETGNFLKILVVNVEALASDRISDHIFEFVRCNVAMLVVDESTTIRDRSSKRTKVLINLGKYAEYRRICSGNPQPNGPLQLYSQTEFLKPNLLGFGNYFAFRNRYAVLEDTRLSGNRSFKTVVGYRDLEDLKRRLRQFSFIIRKEDCLTLPPKIYQDVDVEMGPEQTKVYNRILQESYAALEGGEQVTTPMVITQLVKLHQVACGFIRTDSGTIVDFSPNDRIEQLLQVLRQCSGKVIVWATYRENIRQILAAISDEFGKGSVVHFYGSSTDEERRTARLRFQGQSAGRDPDTGELVPEVPHDPSCLYMVANPSSGRFGNTWVIANTSVYYANSYDLEFRSQSEDRNHRIGTTSPVTYVDLRVRNTVDDRIVKVLRQKKRLTDQVIASNWRWLLGEVA